MALTADSGLGKTTLLNAILAGPSGMAVSVRTLRDQPGEGAPDAGRVLFMDDAHAIPLDALESLSAELGLGSLNPLLSRIVFAGHPEFWCRLQRPSLAALRDRIAARAVLLPMPYAEAADYVEHLFRQDVSFSRAALSERAVHEILVSARGNPQLLDAGVRRALAVAALSYGRRPEPRSVHDATASPGPVKRPRSAMRNGIACISAAAALALAAAAVVEPGMNDHSGLRFNRNWIDHAANSGEPRLRGAVKGLVKDQSRRGEVFNVLPAAELPPTVDAASQAPHQRALLGEEDPGALP